MRFHVPARRLATVTLLAVALAPAPALAAGHPHGIKIKENRHRVEAVGDGFTLKLTRQGVRLTVDDEEFGDPEAGFPIQRSTIDLTGRPARPFECENGTYTIRTGTFQRTIRFSSLNPRPAPYSPEFARAFPGVMTPFVGVIEGTVTDAEGRELRMLISDLAHEELTPKGFTSIAPIHGLFVDAQGRVRDRISLTGHFRSGPNGEKARYWIEDRGTCRQTADLPYGPGSAGALVTGPLFVLPFKAPVKNLGSH
ncbi:hypothetical protein ACQEU3_05225 [Spirillospora sp. CA-253888]